MTVPNKNGSGATPVNKRQAAQALADRALAARHKADALALAHRAIDRIGVGEVVGLLDA